MRLRNLNIALTGGGRILGTPYVGVRGDQVPQTGTHGGGLAANDVVLPADAAKGIRTIILSHNFPAGTFKVYENTGFTVLGAPNGSYSGTYKLQVDGVDSTENNYGLGAGVAPFSVTIGTTSGSLAFTETGGDTVAVTGVVRVLGVLDFTEAGGDTVSIIGDIDIIDGAVAIVESGSDTFAATGTVDTSGVVLVMGLRRIYADGRFGPTQLPNMDVEEFDDFAFVFTKEMVPNEGIGSVQFQVTSVPSDRPSPLVGGCQLDLNNTAVLQRMQGTQAGTRYHVRCLITTNRGRRLVASCDFGVELE